MEKNFKKRSNLHLLYWIGFSLCIIAIWYLLSILNPDVTKYGDFVQYWAAGKLTILGKNPYSVESIINLREQVGTFTDFPKDAMSMLLYPPWTLPLVIPFGIPGYASSRFIWFVFQLIIVFICARLTWFLYQGPKRSHWVAYLIAFTFIPTLYLLLMGHITSFHLLGVLGFLYFIRKPDHGKLDGMAAGACAALVTIKPQLLLLFLLTLLLWIIRNRQWMVLLGGGLVILIFSIIPLLINPRVFVQFWEAMTSYSVGTWASPALGTVLRRSIGYDFELLQILPTILGIIWLIYYWLKNFQQWDWLSVMPIMILASYLTSPYMWPYDMVVILLPILVLAIELLKRAWEWPSWVILSTYLIITVVSVFHFFFIHNYYYLFWLVPAYSVLYFLGNWLLHNYPSKSRMLISDEI